MFGKVKQYGSKVAAGASLALAGTGSAFAQTGLDTTDILAQISDAQTKGVAIALAVTVMIFYFAGAKYLRRAK